MESHKEGSTVDCSLKLNTDNQLEIVSSVSPARLLQMVSLHDLPACRDALWVLWKLSQDQRIKRSIRELDGVSHMLSCLTSDSPEVARYALRVLCNLSFEEESNVRIRELDGVSTILRCLEFEPEIGEDQELTRSALRTLCNLSADDQNKSEIRQLGGLGLVVDCLETRDMRIIRDTLRVLCNLCVDPENRRMLLTQFGALPKIVEQIQSSDAETRRYALALVINITGDRSYEAVIGVQLPGLPSTMSCLMHSDLEVRRFASRALCNLSRNQQNQAAIALSPTELLHSLQSESDGEVLCYTIVATLHTLSSAANRNQLSANLPELAAILSRNLCSINGDVACYSAAALTALWKDPEACTAARNDPHMLEHLLHNLQESVGSSEARMRSALQLLALILPSRAFKLSEPEFECLNQHVHLKAVCDATMLSAGVSEAACQVNYTEHLHS